MNCIPNRLVFLSLVISSSLSATTIYVPADSATIQSAINGTVDGDTVLVQPGTYIENINFNGKNIVVGSLFLTTADTSYISQTVIDGNQSGSVVTFVNGEDSTAVLSGFTIRNGLAWAGGGIHCSNANPKIQNCLITANTTTGTNNKGGGIYIYQADSTMLVQDCIVTGNSAQGGSGGLLLYYANPRIINVEIVGNSANGGGGIHIDNSKPVITRSTIYDNSTSSSAAQSSTILIHSNSYLTLINCLIYNNSTNGYGGALNFDNNSDGEVINCTITNNSANFEGAAVYIERGSHAAFINTIMWNDSSTYGSEIGLETSNDSVTVSYSNIEGGWPGTGNIDVDPLFVDVTNVDFHLWSGSPCIGAGTSVGAPTIDIDGNPRPNPPGYNPDMGAYENPFGTPQRQPLVLNVPADYSTIQAALTAADSSDTVLVQPGTYYENIIWPDVNGIKLISAGDSSNTVIDGGGISSVIYMNPASATIDTTTLIQGFKITNGGNVSSGGGLLIGSASPILTRLWVTGNTAGYGGGLTLFGPGSPTLTDVNVTGNTASYGGGGGLEIDNSNSTLTDVTVTGNTAIDGGGIYSPMFGSSTMTNVTVTGNMATDNGGGIYTLNGSLTLTNVTASGNTASEGGGIYSSYSNLRLVNSILWNNPPLEIYVVAGSTDVTFSNIQGGWEGEGNIDSNPHFVDSMNGDFHLSDSSPCIGAGTATGAPDTDIEGNSRPDPPGSNPDMGAYENSLANPILEPDIIVSIDTLKFGQVFVNDTVSLELMVGNTGTSDLLIIEVLADTVAYAISPTFAAVSPGSTEVFLVTFAPTAVGDYPGTLTFTSNDPNDSTMVIQLLGMGVLPPVISVTPDSLNIALSTGELAVQTITVSNIGGSDLAFDIGIDNVVGGGSGGFALEFDGFDDHVNYTSFINLKGEITLEAWVKHDELPNSTQRYVSIIPEIAVIRHDGVYSSGQLHFYITTDGSFKHLRVDNALQVDQWNHIAGTWDGSTQRLYLNGEEIANQIPGGSLDPAENMFLSSDLEAMDGIIEEVRIWDFALTQQEIQSGMSQGMNGYEAGLIGYWPFDEGSGNIVYDASGNGNYGVITGASWVVSDAPVSPSWMSIAPTVGSVPADSSMDILVNLDADGLSEGDYFADIVISSNDPVDSLVVVPALLSILVLSVEPERELPQSFALHQNYPNPFNPTSTIQYDLPEAANVTLVIYDMLGREVITLVDQQMQPGYHRAVWDARDRAGRAIPTGIYIARLVTPQYTKSIKMVLLK